MKNLSHTKLYSPPLSTSQLLLGHALEYRRDPLGFFQNCARNYGDFVRLRFGPYPVYFLNHPDLIREVFITQGNNFLRRVEGREARFFHLLLGDGLLTSKDELWRHQRRLLQPIFHRNRISNLGDIIVATTTDFISQWQAGDVFDIQEMMLSLTRRIIEKILFGEDTDAISEPLNYAIITAIAEYEKRVGNLFLAVLLDKFPTLGNLRYQKAISQLNLTLLQLIQERRQNSESHFDLLTMLMHMEDEAGKTMSDTQLRDEVINQAFGHDPMANVFTWAWWLLSQHPHIEERLFLEWQTVLNGRLPTMSDLSQLTYTEWVILEVLRLYPPTWITSRPAIADCQIGGHTIRAGQNVTMSQWVMHRDPRYFENPDQFNPDRWANDLSKHISPCIYFPFGLGQRVCIGRALAMMESVLVLSTIGQKFRFSPLPNQQVKPIPTFTLPPEHGIKMSVVCR